MKALPETSAALVLRTDFTDDAAWESVCAAIRAPQTEDEFQAVVECVSDPAFSDVTTEQLLALNETHYFIFVVDSLTISDADSPVLVVDMQWEPGRTFRVIPSEMWGVENNLSLRNMDFREFAENVDEQGVHRGFPE